MQVIRDRNRLRMQQRRNNMRQMERDFYLQNLRNIDHERRNNMNDRERQQFLHNRRNRDQARRNNMNQQERQQHLENVRNRVQHHRNAVSFENQTYYIGALNVRCQFCGALRFQREQLNCCHNGKVSLPSLQEYPRKFEITLSCRQCRKLKFQTEYKKV